MKNEHLSYSSIRVICNNDKNGNPRRGWIVTTCNLSTGVIWNSFLNEGFDGDIELRHKTDGRPNVQGYLNVTAGEFKRIKEDYARL